MSYMIEERTHSMTVRLSKSEVRMLKALATLDGVSVSDAARMAIRRSHAERCPTAPPPKTNIKVRKE